MHRAEQFVQDRSGSLRGHPARPTDPFGASLSHNPLGEFLHGHTILSSVVFCFIPVGFPLAATFATGRAATQILDVANWTCARREHEELVHSTSEAQKALEAERETNVTPHVAESDKGRRSKIDRRTTRHEGYSISLNCRWLVEKGFGWIKQTGPVRQVKVCGLHKVEWVFVFSCTAHKLMRLPRLIAQRAEQGLRQKCA